MTHTLSKSNDKNMIYWLSYMIKERGPSVNALWLWAHALSRLWLWLNDYCGCLGWLLLWTVCCFDEHEHFSTRLIYESFPSVFFRKQKVNFPRVIMHITNTPINRSRKLSTPSCLEVTYGFGSGLVTGSGQLSSFFLNHARWSLVASGDSATFKIALETSATKGDPIGKTRKREIWILPFNSIVSVK